MTNRSPGSVNVRQRSSMGQPSTSSGPAATPDLEADWARFEAQQELQELKRRSQR
jgi:hypothetical protein